MNRTCKENFLLEGFGRKTYCSLLCDRLQGNLTTKLSTFAGNFLLAMDIINDMNHFQLLHLKVQVVANK